MDILPKQTTNQAAEPSKEEQAASVGAKPPIPADKNKFSPSGPPRLSPRSGGAGGEAGPHRLGETGPPIRGRGLKLPPLKQIGRGLQEAKWPVVASAVILALVFLVWGGFFFYHKSLAGKKADLEKKAEELNSAENREMTQKILNLESGLKEAKGLLNSHVFSSEAFILLENNILPGVRLGDFRLNVQTAEISTSGLAQSYSTLAKQLLVMEKLDSVEEVKVSGVALSQLGGVGFQMSVILNKDFFAHK